jgi:four helix bundle protein
LEFGVTPTRRKMQDFKNLVIWQKAHLLAVAVYQATSVFPKEEIYGLTSQMRKAGISIPSNIAEGCGREGNAELSRFFQISLGSTRELEYQILLAHELKFLGKPDYERLDNQVGEVRKMLISFIKKVKQEIKN